MKLEVFNEQKNAEETIYFKLEKDDNNNINLYCCDKDGGKKSYGYILSFSGGNRELFISSDSDKEIVKKISVHHGDKRLEIR